MKTLLPGGDQEEKLQRLSATCSRSLHQGTASMYREDGKARPPASNRPLCKVSKYLKLCKPFKSQFFLVMSTFGKVFRKTHPGTLAVPEGGGTSHLSLSLCRRGENVTLSRCISSRFLPEIIVVMFAC